eukprot:XP_019923325.1 PREDICTED: multiple epidermal growth factor-like domains protein 10 isoform X3 [Crassostrea gigas]
MHILCVFLSMLGLFCLSSTYENIAINKPAWQQYPYQGKPEWGADRAVDGNKSDLSFAGEQCVISANYRSTAEWRVDLGEVLSIHHIFIQYRTGNVVWSCPEPGYNGEDCSSPCSENCQEGHCDIVNKTCWGCVAGYIGSQCIEECIGGTFGLGCINTCGKCAKNKHCHHINGSCMNGCDPGFYGYQCTKICEPGKYGIGCQQRCSSFCHTSGICHHITGACKDGCKSGWKGAECLEVQDNGKTSTTLYVVIASLVVLVINNAVLVLCVILLRKHRKKQKKHKTYEPTKKENVFTQDISGYDSVVSRNEENYQELATVTADR